MATAKLFGVLSLEQFSKMFIFCPHCFRSLVHIYSIIYQVSYLSYNVGEVIKIRFCHDRVKNLVRRKLA